MGDITLAISGRAFPIRVSWLDFRRLSWRRNQEDEDRLWRASVRETQVAARAKIVLDGIFEGCGVSESCGHPILTWALLYLIDVFVFYFG